METWLEWAKGPAFIGALSFMVLGLARHVVLTLWEVNRSMRRAGDKTISYQQIALGYPQVAAAFFKNEISLFL